MARSKPRRIFLFTTVIILSIVFGGSFGVLTAYFRTTPDLTDVQFRQSFTTHIFDVNGRLITDLFREHRVPVSIYDVPKHVKEAVIAIEDDRFYEHHGVNFYAFGRAIIVNLREQRFAQGGGTITMQLARNVFLTQDKTVVRKLEEFLWAWQIERQYSKEEILEAYLNEVHVGHGANGVEAASQLYFGKSVNQLTLSEAAMIAGVIRWPVRYSPFNNPDIAVERRDFVLSRMQELGYISAQEAQSARAEELNPTARTGRVVNAPYFVDYIIQELTPLFGEDRIFGGGLRIHTSLDLDMQAAAETHLLEGLPRGGTDPNGLLQPQGALITIDPSTGEIRSMVGGRGDDKFNRAAQALRSPGSAIKIFPYTAAIDKGITPADVYVDEATEFVLTGGQRWSPQNYSGTFLGIMTIREAVERSNNIIAAKIVQELGYQTVMDYGKAMGITSFVEQGRSNDMGLSPLALGGLTRGISPLELASAYGILANQGIRVAPAAVLRVEDAFGNLLYRHQTHQSVVLNETTAYLMTDMLRGVMERGTGTNARIGRPAAGKTGTHQNYQDAWFVGYTPDLVTAIWFGADIQERMVYGGVRYGSWNAATIWGNYMRDVVRDMPVTDFAKPDGLLENVAIDIKTGLLVRDNCTLPQDEIRLETFIRGTEPTSFSPRCSTR